MDADAQLARLSESLPGCLIPNSFTADTRVLLADGTARPIQDLRAGERVVSTVPASGQTEPEPVSTVITGTGSKSLVDVTVAAHGDTGGKATITATDNHPFWVPDLKQWVPASALQVGQWLRTSSGTWVQVSAIRRHTEQATVYNLTVAAHHTFYVVAGTTSVLVHNTAPCGTGGYTWAKPGAPTNVLGTGEAWDPSTGIPVLGRQVDTEVVGSWPGYTYLNIPAWTLEKNDAYIQTIIDRRGTVYIASPIESNYWNAKRNEPTVFAREIQQLLQAGYTWSGDYMVPPSP